MVPFSLGYFQGRKVEISMPKRVTVRYESMIVLDHTSSVPLYRQLYDRVRLAILTGQLVGGTRLPATRTLADQLRVSRNTVYLAYQQLLAEGYINSKVGHGTSVARVIPETLLTIPSLSQAIRPAQDHTSPSRVSQRGMNMARMPAMPGPQVPSQPGKLPAFRAGVPALDLFPFQIWAQMVTRRARHSLQNASDNQDGAGYRPLREAIAAHIGVTRGVRCTADQVIVVSGTQAALDLAARILLDPGDMAWIEDPGYPGARGALQGAGAQLVPIPVKEDGLDVRAGRIRCPQARLAYVTPSHQFPLGVTMSLAQRLALLEWANEANAWILEDDYDSEYRFSGRPLEALQGLDRTNRVIYLGTFSKVLFPALRLGYLVVPPDLTDIFVAVRHFVDRHVPILEQMALADFITEGHFIRHIRRMHTRYTERRAALIAALANEPGEMIEVHAPEAGMHLVGWLPPHMDDSTVAQQAATYGVEVMPVSMFSSESMHRGGLVLGYAAVNEQEIRDGVHRLAMAIRSMPRPTSIALR
jgi:GntR family transcriptional regulator / MocR family aminotransferase